jgi:hypothetical protein
LSLAWWSVPVGCRRRGETKTKPAEDERMMTTIDRSRSVGWSEPAPALWHPHRGARVSLIANRDGSFSPRAVKVTLHSAGMLVERQIAVPLAVRMQTFASRDAAAAAALEVLELGRPVAI